MGGNNERKNVRKKCEATVRRSADERRTFFTSAVHLPSGNVSSYLQYGRDAKYRKEEVFDPSTSVIQCKH